jgi:hypothetical protein
MGMYGKARRLCGSNKAILVWIPGYQGMPGNKETDKFVKEWTNKFPCDQTTGIPFVVYREVNRESCVRSTWRGSRPVDRAASLRS